MVPTQQNAPSNVEPIDPLVAPVQSDLEKQVQAHTEEETRLIEAKALVKKKVAFAKRKLSGQLNRAEFEALPSADRLGYRRTFGVPLTPAELRAKKEGVTKKAKNKKIARKSRAQNRSR